MSNNKDNRNVVENDDAAVNAQQAKDIQNVIDHGTTAEEYDRIADRANAEREGKPGIPSDLLHKEPAGSNEHK